MHGGIFHLDMLLLSRRIRPANYAVKVTIAKTVASRDIHRLLAHILYSSHGWSKRMRGRLDFVLCYRERDEGAVWRLEARRARSNIVLHPCRRVFPPRRQHPPLPHRHIAAQRTQPQGYGKIVTPGIRIELEHSLTIALGGREGGDGEQPADIPAGGVGASVDS
jgi:hypothetical protein